MNEAEELMSGKPESKKKGTVDKAAYAAAQTERRNHCYEMIDSAAVEVVSSSDKFRRYLDIQSRFDKLSANNNLLIYMQKPDATELKEYKAWQSDGKQVKQGSHAVDILEPVDGKDSDGNPRTYFNPKGKFDVSDLTEPVTDKSVSYDERLLVRALVNECPVKVETTQNYPTDKPAGAYFDVARNCIVAKAGMKPIEIYTSVSMALAHAEMARYERDNADKEKPVPEYRPSAHEFQARCSAYILAAKFGVPTEQVAVQSIPPRYAEYKAEDIKRELAEINRTVKSVVERMYRKLEPEKTQGKSRSDSRADRDER